MKRLFIILGILALIGGVVIIWVGIKSQNYVLSAFAILPLMFCIYVINVLYDYRT